MGMARRMDDNTHDEEGECFRVKIMMKDNEKPIMPNDEEDDVVVVEEEEVVNDNNKKIEQQEKASTIKICPGNDSLPQTDNKIDVGNNTTTTTAQTRKARVVVGDEDNNH